jgi:hypothetical protein
MACSASCVLRAHVIYLLSEHPEAFRRGVALPLVIASDVFFLVIASLATEGGGAKQSRFESAKPPRKGIASSPETWYQ